MRTWKGRILVAAAVAALVAGNHVEHSLRAAGIRRKAAAQDAPVMEVVDNAAGHSSIRIDEGTRRAGYLYFNTLEAWAYNKDKPTPCPASVMEANGHNVKLIGFMYPLQEAANLTVFCLLRSTQTCCYGPRPQYNQYVFVEVAKPVKFERLAPVVVEGRFVVDPKPDEGYIYRMQGESVRPAAANDQPVGAAEFARQNRLAIFDFAPLEAARTAADRDAGIARLAADLDGKQVVVEGFLVGKAGDSPPRIMLGRYAWDGKAAGTPPNLYNTVLVAPRTSGDAPPVWWREAVFKGTLHVTTDPAQQAKNGIVSLHEAVLAVAPASGADALVDTGPLVPVLYEILIVGACAGMLVMGLLSGKKPAASGETT
ncbi:MAG: DUF3299 domain-containing protein [Planctomycetota bacterium]|nr:DUF3299 domain-containing protein [Planctomycetota bacterium]